VNDPAPETSTADAATFGALVRFALGEAGAKTGWALAFTVLASLSEGVSILLVLPLLHLLGPDGTVRLDLPALPVLTIGLPQLLAMLVLLVLGQALFARFKAIYMLRMLHAIVNGARAQLFASIGAARWDEVRRHRAADLHHLLTADVERVRAAVVAALALMQTGILLLIYAGISWIVSPAMTLLAAALGLMLLLLLAPLRRRAMRHGRLRSVRNREQFRLIGEFLGGLKLAKSFNAERRFASRFADLLARDTRAAIGYTRLASVGTIAGQLFAAIAVSVFILVGTGPLGLSAERLILLILLLMRIAPRFQSIHAYGQDITVNLPAFAAVQAARRRFEAEREPGDGRWPVTTAGRIHLDDVQYRADRGAPILKGVSITLPARQITALVGASGSGKTTAADLLMGLLRPSAGAVRVDGVAITYANCRAWRARVAYVPQEIVLLHDSVAANLALADPAADRPALWAALEQAGAAAFVRRLPDGLDTIIGDRGNRLSGGERQRIALARALLARPVLLILDEATSALDWENQRLIARSIERLRGVVTIVTIAHRPSMIAVADQVIVLDRGRVVEQGSHAELAARADSRLAAMLRHEQGHPPVKLREVG